MKHATEGERAAFLRGCAESRDELEELAGLREENAKLREQLRWRKTSEGPPELNRIDYQIPYSVLAMDWYGDAPPTVRLVSALDVARFPNRFREWRPLGPLPGEQP
jgi:hypothetical protein